MDPARWPGAIEVICTSLNCFAGIVALEHRNPSRTVLAKHWNYNSAWIARLPENSSALAELTFSNRQQSAEIAEAQVDVEQLFANDAFFGTQWGKEILLPGGVGDSIHFLLLSDPFRLAVFGVSRHASLNPMTEEQVAQVRQLNPHIRRAILISDTLNGSEVRAEMLGETLDGLAAGVVVVSGSSGILFANKAAKRMLDGNGPIVSRHGQLAASNGSATAELRAAISLADEELNIGEIGSSTPIVGERPAVAHVLPLRNGARARLISEAAAAVFVNASAIPPVSKLEALSRLYDLTPAETQMLGELLSGKSLAEIARKLDISEATAKTHRTHVFAKTGVSRRAELAALAWPLMPVIDK